MCAFSIDPDWNEHKRLAVINADFNVLIYDFETGIAMKAHKGHDSQVSYTIKILFHAITLFSFNRENK